MERLDCHVKEYAWGKPGEMSEVARLFSAGHKHFRIGAQTPYAELWMGTHPDGPAKVRASSECLSRMIAKNSENDLINNNNNSIAKDEIHLPFIMKIMSIKHTLSLQVHPTKEQASRLHERDPKHYPDRNHKPELAYALTRFELLCGFRPAEQIIENMRAFPELRKVMGETNCELFEKCYNQIKTTSYKNPSNSDELKSHLRLCFATMLQLQIDRPKFVEEQLKSLYYRIDNNARGCLIKDTIDVMLDTYKRFPQDVGCFAPLYLNHMILHPGECCYYAAEELHAYLSGECVECVGCSNNTIRAGLTPKYIDRENLIDVLNYRMTDPKFYMVKPCPLTETPNIVEFAPTDCEDFTLREIQIPARIPSIIEDQSYKEKIDIPALDCPSIIVIVEGVAECEEIDKKTLKNFNETSIVQRGDIFYIPPRQKIRLNAVTTNLHINGENAKAVNGRPIRKLLAYQTFSYNAGPDHSNRLIKPLLTIPCKLSAQEKLASKNVTPTILDAIKLSKKLNNTNGGVEHLTRHEVLFDIESEMDGFL